LDVDPKIRELSGERPNPGVWFKPALLGATPGNLKSFIFLLVIVLGFFAVVFVAAKLR
jgi:hypothetical protein